MMRTPRLALTALALSLLVPVAAPAQGPYTKTKIEHVVVGFPSTEVEGNFRIGEFKPGAWTPVYVTLTAPFYDLLDGHLIVEAADTDDVRNRYVTKLPPMDRNTTQRFLTYIKPGSTSLSVEVEARGGKDHSGFREDQFAAAGSTDVMFLCAGSRLIGLRRALMYLHNKDNKTKDVGALGDDQLLQDRDTGPRRHALIDEVDQMPTRWFAYESADVVLLTSGNREFIQGFLDEQRKGKQALAEWVRRGGRLVVCAGRNQDVVAKLDEQLSLLPMRVAGAQQFPSLPRVRQFAQVVGDELQNPADATGQRPPILGARLEPKPDRPFDVILGDKSKGEYLAVQGSYGLGRVTLVAFDFDTAPFKDWKGQRQFWEKFVADPRLAPGLVAQPNQNPGVAWMPNQANELTSQMAHNLEEFEDVPVISFGWVALFILVYILIVGPLDYFFLKKVLKRLELTWVTFPTVVVAISVIAYFTAYWLKGNDQKINKVDLVDYDLHAGQVYGQSWFTVFSPRIQHYTIGLEPTAPGWVPAGVSPSLVLSWFGRTELHGYGRSGSGSLFRRTYEYADDASGLRNVPIQVWSTKSFVGAWEAPVDAKAPAFSANVQVVQNAGQPLLKGTITSNLPTELHDAVLFYDKGDGGRWYALDLLTPGTPVRLDNLIGGEAQNAQDMNTWLNNIPPDSLRKGGRPNPRNNWNQGVSAQPTASVVKNMMFYDSVPRNAGNLSVARSGTLRPLDQTWRLRRPYEAILFARVPRTEGRAESMADDAKSPTRLWLGALPGGQARRPDLFGTLAQETYVRVLIPVEVEKKN